MDCYISIVRVTHSPYQFNSESSFRAQLHFSDANKRYYVLLVRVSDCRGKRSLFQNVPVRLLYD